MRRSYENPGRRPAANRVAAAIRVAGALAVLALASCASGPYVPSQSAIMKTVDLIDSGGIGAIKGLAEAPFLFDGEILALQADVDALWGNLKAAGFTLGAVKVASVAKIDAETYTYFAPSMEVKTFLAKRVDKNCALVALDSASGRYYLILNREVSGYPRIQGFRGPVK